MSVKNFVRFACDRVPGQLVIQLTNHCNAHCPQCGMRRRAAIVRRRLPTDEVKRILDAAARKGFQAVSFTGGEPLLFTKDLITLIRHAGRVGIPFIRTGTNGFLFREAHKPRGIDRIKRFIDALAETSIRNFWISLDSARSEVHETMRGLPGVVAGIAKALPLFRAAGIYPAANLGINRNIDGPSTSDVLPSSFRSPETYLHTIYVRYRNAFDRFYRFVEDVGFDMVNVCYPMSIGEEERDAGLSAVYGATSPERLVAFSGSEKAIIYRALLAVIPRHRSHLRIFTPLSSVYALWRQHGQSPLSCPSSACRGGRDFFFVGAMDGDTYPCGYRGGENLGKFWRLDTRRRRAVEDCRRCDWECFRDPSELCAPLLTAMRKPWRLIGSLLQNRAHYRHWLRDIRYYKACNFFDGRVAADLQRLAPFRIEPQHSGVINTSSP
jgi:MoaA/NifB/PqqE/SkfB family radical SAM enzyme